MTEIAAIELARPPLLDRFPGDLLLSDAEAVPAPP
jgi:hypothetical protein